MPKQQQPQGPSATQLKGEDGTLETVTVGGVRMNKHEHDPETDGAAEEGEESSTPRRKRRSKKSEESE